MVDKRGNAVVNLKLDDFELRVDGELRPLSDLTRSETSVRLTMLFDNSGSLDAAREFEKQAAIRFFRKVMRPIDEAAIYSIETDSYLAQPLTHDIVRLATDDRAVWPTRRRNFALRRDRWRGRLPATLLRTPGDGHRFRWN